MHVYTIIKHGLRLLIDYINSVITGIFWCIFDGHGGSIAAKICNVEEAVKNGYLVINQNFLKESISGGTCCITTLIQNHNLVISNVGDCRAVMSRRGVVEALTSNHRLSRKDERDRIQTLVSIVNSCMYTSMIIEKKLC